MRPVVPIIAATAMLSACGDGRAPESEETAQSAAEDLNRGTAESAAEREPMPDRDDVLGSDAVSQGQWHAKTERGVPQALFGPPRTEANFLVRCEGGELVFIRSLPIEGEQTEMVLMAGGETRTLTARERAGPLPQTTARLPASDPFAETLAKATQPIAVRLGEGASLRMPAHDSLRRVVANCGG